MFISKAQLVRLAVIALIVLTGWTIWRRLDAIIDNYKSYYDFALGVQVIQDMWEKEDKKFQSEWEKQDKEFQSMTKEDTKEFQDRGEERKRQTGESVEDKWKQYEKNATLKPHNKPVPMIADEWAKGYYSGFWNFMITSGFASIFLAVIVVIGCGFGIRFVIKKLTDEKINNILDHYLRR